ncbi:MAG: glycosyltransferase family 2 protein [Ruminococcaceae bacterium]|nr:glycosyltransferase family 2 protein [Oscillospiraceae bacterium]
MKLLTIFTPTYNRAHTLPRLYESLCAQTDKRFEWIVVNDGSTDNTNEVLNRIQREQAVNIIVINKENGGKPRAINDGLKTANGEFFFMVDSDDYITPDAVERLFCWCREIEDDERFVAVGAARAYPNGEYIKGVAPKIDNAGYVDATNLERALYDLDADMCEAYKTDIFKKFPFKVWDGENFAPEQIVLNEMALSGYKIRWRKDKIYICEYLDDGLTKGSDSLMRRNPMGYAMMYDHMLKYGYPLKKRIKCVCNMTALATIGKHPFYFLKSNAKFLGALTFFPSLLLAARRKKQFRSM